MPADNKKESDALLNDISDEEKAPEPKRRVSPRRNKGKAKAQKQAAPKKKKRVSDKEFADDTVDEIDSVM